MVERITGTNRTQATQKSKKTQATGQTSGVSFADMLSQAQATTETTATQSVTPVTPRTFNNDLGSGVPSEPRARGHHILDQLEQLEQAVLGDEPTAALDQLREAIASEAIGKDELPPKLQRILEDVDLRAAIEVAKVEATSEEEQS